MKKRRLTPALAVATVLALGIASAGLTGCITATGTSEEVLATLEDLQAQIDELKAEQDTSEESSGTQEATDTDSSSTDSTTTSESNSSSSSSSSTSGSSSSSSGITTATASEFTAQIEDLSSRVDEAVATSEAVSVPSSLSERVEAYFDAKASLEEFEYELDIIEDSVEASYRQGLLTRDELWSLEQQLDVIDDTLDRAGDALELRMGVDD